MVNYPLTLPRRPARSAQPSLCPLIAGLFLAAFAGATLTGCAEKQVAAHQTPPPPVVTVAQVEERELVEWNEFSGRVEPVEMVEIRPRVSGHIQEVRFQAGQLVKKGDVLFVIDQRWHQATFQQREAEYVQAKVRLETAKREAERTAQLLENKAISTEEAETRQSRFQEAQAGLLAAEAARQTARLDLDFTEVRAPVAGRVSRALVTPGNYVAGVAGSTTLLTTIVSVDPVYVYADADENWLLKFNSLLPGYGSITNVPVELQLGDETGFPHRGHIESLDNRLDPNTGSILLRALFPDPEGRIVPGLFARIRVPGSQRYRALLVDERAIGTDQAQKFVMALTPTNTVEYRSVKLGPEVEGRRIVRAGLERGDKIVVNGTQRVVRPGMPVTPQEAVATNEMSNASLP